MKRTGSSLTHHFILSLAVCTLALFAAAMPLSADDWTLKSPVTKPSPRFDHPLAYIGSDQVLLFGGFTGSFNDETWVYDLSDNTWTLKSPATKPSARDFHAMAYLGGDQVLLFGGLGAGLNRNDETWVYDLGDNTWTLKSPSTKPSARHLHAMAYIGGDQVLLFGGLDDLGSNGSDETWVYDLSDNAWTLKSPSTKPSGRTTHAMASIGGDQVLLFGGNPLSDETWVYDLSDNTWTQKSPATKPLARFIHAMASIGGDQVLLFGGQATFPTNFVDDTWVYDLSDNTWTLKSPVTKPSARFSHAMASIGGDQVLLFGGAVYDAGFNLIVNNETWIYNASAFAAQVQQPINADGSSVFNGARNVVPVKFTLTADGAPTCVLPPATISVVRTAGGAPGPGGALGPIDESVYQQASDNGSSFRIDSCQYVYNLAARSLGPGTYLVQININGVPVGSATFGLK